MVYTNSPTAIIGVAFAQTDLMLYLLRTRPGVMLVDTMGRVLLVDDRHTQALLVLPVMLANGNMLTARLVARIGAALPNSPSVQALADEPAMSQHTLSRHVRETIGRSTFALVQSVRLNRACILIESSSMITGNVAEAVGYEDATALWCLMCRVSGTNPGQYWLTA